MAKQIESLLSKEHIEQTEAIFVEQAKTLGLLDDYGFMTTYRNYKNQLRLIDEMYQTIQTKLSAGEDANSDVTRFNQAGNQADRFLTKIRAIISDRKKELPPKVEEAEEL